MPALNFKKQFVPLIESGEKHQTIRVLRKDGRKPKVGEALYLYTGMRTKNCQKLKEVICKSVTRIVISRGYLRLNEVFLHSFEKLQIAFADGFETYQEFQNFFEETHGLPFHGIIISW